MEKRKKLITILSATIIVTAIFAPLLLAKNVAAADPTDWYMTVNGVLDSDTYLLYPYASESLKVGLSKFGELIDSNNNVGLEYAGARDPFAAPAGSSVDESKLPKKVWINGWYIDIRYVHEDWGPRCVWAGALFADKSDYGRNWIRVDNNYTYPLHPLYEWEETFDDKGLELDDFTPIPGLVNGGRKTNGTAITEPMTVLYDGPRLFVAMSVTHVYDWYEEEDEPLHLVDVVLTIMFNKVKKEVVVIKDVKFIEQAKFVLADLPITTPQEEEITIPQAILIQLSNREEWDLGAKDVAGTIDYSSYVHFYTAGTATNDASSEGQSTVYNENWTMLPTLPAGVAYDGVEINAWGPEPGASGTYDVAQIISNDEAYVGWHAFWPSLSDWSADAARSSVKTWFRAMTADDPHWIDAYSGSEPFTSPLIVGEWDFILADREEEVDDGVKIGRQFRGVSVYGVTDLNDGDDEQLGGYDVIDTEVLYQLDEVFNPWDLNDAVHKKAGRFVEFTEGETTWTTDGDNVPVIVVSDEEWDDYCVFAERVENLETGELLVRGVDYTVTQNEDGTMTLYDLPEGVPCKILYSTYGMYVTSEDNENNTLDGVPDYDMDVDIFSYDAQHPIEFNIFTPPFETTQVGYTVKLKIKAWDVDLENGEIDAVYLNGYFVGTLSGYGSLDSISEFEVPAEFLDYSGQQLVQIFVSCNTSEPLPVTIDPASSTTWPNGTDDWCVAVDWGKLVFQPRYEWDIVGRDAHTIDSAGAALVSAAFKNKQVEIGLAGADMYESNVANQMPWVMSKIGTDDEWTDYYYDYGAGDYRTALKDDWCTTWPISSSNMIGVGGPLANLLAYYGNDFMMAIFGLSDGTKYGDFTDYADWENVIIPLTCWDITKTQTYSSSNETGYAVISTYKDINGTVLFLVWGHWGRDTYYACKWFHEEGIYQLQEAPEGLTAIILEITFESTDEGYKPTDYSIVECLGTISETEWTHDSETKGGFHDP